MFSGLLKSFGQRHGAITKHCEIVELQGLKECLSLSISLNQLLPWALSNQPLTDYMNELYKDICQSTMKAAENSNLYLMHTFLPDINVRNALVDALYF